MSEEDFIDNELSRQAREFKAPPRPELKSKVIAEITGREERARLRRIKSTWTRFAAAACLIIGLSLTFVVNERDLMQRPPKDAEISIVEMIEQVETFTQNLDDLMSADSNPLQKEINYIFEDLALIAMDPRDFQFDSNEI